MTAPSPRQEIPFTPEMVEKVLSAVGQDGVLVGGQALAFWVALYQIQIPGTGSGAERGSVPISRDTDFLGKRGLVQSLAAKIPGGKPTFQLKSAISRIVGVVEIDMPEDNGFMNVDVIDKVAGLELEHVEKRAIDAKTESGILFKVLHPLDVLASRVYNIANFEEKQNENGFMQVQLALQVANCFIRGSAHELGEKVALRQIEEVVSLAKSTEGRIAIGYGADFMDAIPYHAIQSQNFNEIRLPQIFRELDSLTPPQYMRPAASPTPEEPPAGDYPAPT